MAVPQGSALGPLLFLVYIIDVAEGLKSSVERFSDDTLFFLLSRIMLNPRINLIVT